MLSPHLRERLAVLPDNDTAAVDAVHDRAANLLRPSGALAWLDEIAAWVAGWQRTSTPAVDRPAALIFAGDHGVAAATKVSAYPTGITQALFDAYLEGRSTIAAFAQIAGATVSAAVVGAEKGPKVTGFTYKAKANQRRRWGHRQKYDVVEITSIATA